MVDAVITWVDGEDPSHREKMLPYLSIPEDKADKKGMRSTRFRESGELRFCIELIRKNAPWIGSIFLVTDNQRPKWLNTELERKMGVRIIDHRELFSWHEEYLPVFSSRSIETLLYNVPGIADRFIYFNDDVFLVNPVAETDFFRESKSVMRGKWQKPLSFPEKIMRETKRFTAKYRPDSGFRDGYSGRRAEKDMFEEFREEYFSMAHTAFPVIRPFMEKIIHDTGLFTNAAYRFRNKKQFSPMAFYTHKGFLEGIVTEGKEDWEYINCTAHSARVIKSRLEKCESDDSIKTLCVQSLEMAGSATQEMIKKSLAGMLEREA